MTRQVSGTYSKPFADTFNTAFAPETHEALWKMLPIGKKGDSALRTSIFTATRGIEKGKTAVFAVRSGLEKKTAADNFFLPELRKAGV